ncbi:MAG: hypothetical protein IT319_02660 [Anaerolineae bacterium]|nr:hypothetical protein [Anaerolineae bacterium]
MNPKRLIAIPLLGMALLIASCNFNPAVLRAIILANATPTSTPTSIPQITSVTERIRFAAGATSAQVSGQIDGTSFHTYFVEARAGQQMQARVSSPYGNVYLTVVSPGGTPLARAQAGAQSFDGILPETGDYVLQVTAPVGTPATTYVLNVSITGGIATSTPIPQPTQAGVQRIHFAAGSTWAQVAGRLDAPNMVNYVLEARAGQQALFFVSSPSNNAYLTVVSPSGSPLARAQAGAQSFNGTLPENGDYRLTVSSPDGTAHTDFALYVSVTGSVPPSATPSGSTRIQFPPGATGTTVTGNIASGGLVGYLLSAGAGQRLQISLTSPGSNVYLSVIAPSGAMLANASLGERSLDHILSESGDYVVQVSTLSGTPNTNYALQISITGEQPAPTSVPTGQPPTVQPPPSAQRISFAPGTSSAQVSGQVGGYTVITYLLEALAGQNMQVTVSSPTNNVFLSVLTPGGAFLVQAAAGAKSFTGTLPQSGDYTFRVSTTPGGATTSYTLNVTVTGAGQPLPPTLPPSTSAPPSTAIPPSYQRIQFAPGATSAAVNGQVDSSGFRGYLVGASAGQRMVITLTSPGNNVYLTVYSPSGSTMANASFGETSLDRFLPENGDYTIQVSTPGGTTNFTLQVSITS